MDKAIGERVMIHDQDRSGWFGASDTKFVMAENRNTKTWLRWWETKLGKAEPSFTGSIYTRAGNLYEHHILEAINPDMRMDGQIIIDKLLLRTNYDGYCDGVIYEVKTHKSDKEFEITPAYLWQCQVEAFCYKEKYKQWFLPEFKKIYIVSYALYPDEYYCEDGEIGIDPDRIIKHEVKYDKHWVKAEYLPRLKELARALRKGRNPIERRK